MGEAGAKTEPQKVPQPAETGKADKDTPKTGSNNMRTEGAAATESATVGESQPNLASNTQNTENQPKVVTAAAPEQSHRSGAGEDISFDSMLNNNTAGGVPNEFDLHLDFGNDDVGNHNFLSSHNFVNLGAGNNSGFMAGLQQNVGDGTANRPPPQQGEQQPGAQVNNNSEEVIAPGESSFDDLFMERDNFGGGGAGDQGLLEGDRLMNINELDDNWFTWLTGLSFRWVLFIICLWDGIIDDVIMRLSN